MFSRPQSLDVLLYLDDIDDANGPLRVVPGSHHWIHEDLSVNDFEEKPGQVTLRFPAGSCVMAHGAAYVLVVKTNVYTLSDEKAPEPFAAQKVRVIGILDAKTKTIRVESIVAQK